MKPALVRDLSLSLTGFTTAVLLGHLFVAYPMVRSGVVAVLLLGLLGVAVFGVVCLFMMLKASKGQLVGRGILPLSLALPGIVFVGYILAIGIGVVVVGG